MPKGPVLGGLLENQEHVYAGAEEKIHQIWLFERGERMQRSMRLCKKMAFWDIYKKDVNKLGGVVLGLRCPLMGEKCKHKTKHEDGRMFCKNYPLHDEIRANFKRRNKEKANPLGDEPEKKAA
jgi:hypothetical protein